MWLAGCQCVVMSGEMGRVSVSGCELDGEGQGRRRQLERHGRRRRQQRRAGPRGEMWERVWMAGLDSRRLPCPGCRLLPGQNRRTREHHHHRRHRRHRRWRQQQQADAGPCWRRSKERLTAAGEMKVGGRAEASRARAAAAEEEGNAADRRARHRRGAGAIAHLQGADGARSKRAAAGCQARAHAALRAKLVLSGRKVGGCWTREASKGVRSMALLTSSSEKQIRKRFVALRMACARCSASEGKLA